MRCPFTEQQNLRDSFYNTNFIKASGRLLYLQIDSFTLKWQLNPPTANMWANRISLHWDQYLDYHFRSLPTSLAQKMDLIKFRTQGSQGYSNFRTLMQYIDVSVFDIDTLQYHSRQLAASFLYIVLNTKLQLYRPQQIVEIFSASSQYLLKQNQLNEFYCQFLQSSFNFCLKDLLPTIQYCSTYFILPLSFQLPSGINQDNEQQEITYSEFCSLQTYNNQSLPTIFSRNRQFD